MKARRRRYEGVLLIVRCNWPFYVVAGAVLMLSLVGMMVSDGWQLQSSVGTAAAGCLWFLLGSLGASHWIYDRSDLYRWKWLDGLILKIAQPIQMITFCHTGLDESSRMLKVKFPDAAWRIMDHYDSATMTEGSITRARRLVPPSADTVPTPFGKWNHPTREADLVLGILAIHELRKHSERVQWFEEAKRCVRSEGRVILIEHVRDFANFIAFGPGFLHFHSVATWQRSWEEAGFVCKETFRVTPFVRVFMLKLL